MEDCERDMGCIALEFLRILNGDEVRVWLLLLSEPEIELVLWILWFHLLYLD